MTKKPKKLKNTLEINEMKQKSFFYYCKNKQHNGKTTSIRL